MRSTLSAVVAISLFLGFPRGINAAEPLHARIDQLIEAGHPDFKSLAAPLSSDAEFLRRVTLDLVGTLPTAVETRAFLADKDPQKRTKWIDQLLASEGYSRRMTQFLDVMLMERRPDSKVGRPLWEEYLRTSFQQNKPFDVLAREILSADGADTAKRAPAKFFLDRNFEPNQVTRDLGRLFLGRNLQCAQCHDSPLIDDYKQEHYYGLMAFINRSSLFPPGKGDTAAIGEKADGEVTFTSVFDKNKVQKSTGPKVITLKSIPDQKLEKGKEYKVAPSAPTVRPIPTYSRRELLASAIVESPWFSRNAANRFWAMVMGRGLVHPLDLDHKDNPPSHPELLDLLTKELVDHKFDVKWLLRELVLSKTYQRSSELSSSMKEPPADRYLVAVLKPLSPEQFVYALMQASGYTDSLRGIQKMPNETAVNTGLAAQVAPFVRMLGNQPGQAEEFQASLDQTLYLKHSAAIRNFISQRANCLLDRCGKLTDSKSIANELFLSVYTRPATADEAKDIADILKDAKDRPAVLSEVIWAMLASAEFRFNH